MTTKGTAWTEAHDDAWRVRVKVGGKKKTVSGGHRREEDADVYRDAWNLELDVRGIEDAGGLTLGKLGETWLAGRELHGSRKRAAVKSIDSEKSAWRTHVASNRIATMHPAAIRVRDVEAFALWLRARKIVRAITMGSGSARKTILRPTDQPLSAAMQREALRLLRGALDEGVRQELLKTNPAAEVGVAPGGPRPRDLSEDWLRADEIDRVLACGEINVFARTVFATAIGLALRLDDIKTIEVEHVALDAQVPGPHVRVWIQKSKKWHRVPIPAWLDPWLRAHLKTLPKKGKFLFPGADAERYGEGYDFGWAAHRERSRAKLGAERSTEIVVRPSTLARAGVKRKIRFHDLRGTTATHLALGTWGRTWSLHEIQMMLAHSDQRVTERYVRRAIDSLAQAMKATPGGPTFPPSGPPGSTCPPASEPAKYLKSLGSPTFPQVRTGPNSSCSRVRVSQHPASKEENAGPPSWSSSTVPRLCEPQPKGRV